MSGLQAPGSGRTPPRLADWLLTRVLPRGKSGESILGDLREEFRETVHDAGVSKARRWYWQQAIRLTLRYFTQPARLSPPRRSPMLMDLTSDLRTAFRMLRRDPGTSGLIVATLALAIGAATIGFAFADLALLRGLPVDDNAKVVSIFASDTHGSNSRARVSAPDLLDYRARTTTLEHLSAMRDGRAPLIRNGQSQTLTVTYATANRFAAMGQSLVRAAARARELAVRTAMGARGGRLLRQFLIEGLLLSAIAAGLSIPAAWAGLQAIGLFSAEAAFQQLRIDLHEIGFVATLALVCPVVFSLASARLDREARSTPGPGLARRPRCEPTSVEMHHTETQKHRNTEPRFREKHGLCFRVSVLPCQAFRRRREPIQHCSNASSSYLRAR